MMGRPTNHKRYTLYSSPTTPCGSTCVTVTAYLTFTGGAHPRYCATDHRTVSQTAREQKQGEIKG